MRSRLFLSLIVLLFFSGTSPAAGVNLIPKPQTAVKTGDPFIIYRGTTISSSDFREYADYLNTHVWRAVDYLLTVSSVETAENNIVLRKDTQLPPEGYRLVVKPDKIELSASTETGIYYGIQTLLQLMPPLVYGGQGTKPGQISVPGIEITDSPAFPYRGFMLDVSRTFFDKQSVMRYIDLMSRHKLNKFHWHLSDDNGWRIEIKSYPQLTSAGAWRGPGEVVPASYGSGNRRYGGFYTQNDIREIVSYAAFRGVEIIPEIDLPGHSQVMTHVYPHTFCRSTLKNPSVVAQTNSVICAGKEENYQMLTTIFTELAALFPSKIIHIGGDEVSTAHWQNCAACQDIVKKNGFKSSGELLGYFVGRMEGIVNSLGKECAGWNEIIKYGELKPSTIVYGWENIKVCQEAAAKGQRVVMMPGSYLYLDMKPGISEQGHTWAGMVDTRRVYSFDPSLATLTSDQRKLVMGVEGALFSELMGEEGLADYQIYPKLCALAEVGWTPLPQRDYNDFYHRLTSSHFERLGRMGIKYRMFPPIVSYDGKLLTAKAIPAGAPIDFRVSGDGLSDEFATRYTGPIETDTPWIYDFRSRYHGGYSAPTALSNRHEIILAPYEKRTVSLPVEKYAPFDGIWLMNVTPEEGATINKLEVTGRDTSYVVIRSGQEANPLSYLRLYADNKNSNAMVSYTLTNKSSAPNKLDISFVPSPYIEPAVSVSTSLSINSRFPAKNITDYNRVSYLRSDRACRSGDYIIFTFEEPVSCSRIDLRTGIPNLTRYIVTDGEVLASSDGLAYTSYGDLDDNGTIIFEPSDPVKSIRINIKGGNGEPVVCFEDLRIEP